VEQFIGDLINHLDVHATLPYPFIEVHLTTVITTEQFEGVADPIGDIHPLPPHLILTKTSTDLHFILVGPLSTSNELMLQLTLNAFHDAVSLLLRGQIEKRNVLEGLDLILLAADETIDDG
jgi:hypothetical protein